MSTDRDIPRQAGVLPYRTTSDGLRILLITSSTRKRWIIPKGNIEPHLNELESARIEAYEEAGVRGDVSTTALGSYLHESAGGPTQVLVFAMRVDNELNEWPEADIRRREWMSVEDAHDRILEAGLRSILIDFTDRMS